MEGVLARNVVGFLVQVVPCAVLCLMPFGSRFVCGARHAWARAAAIVAAGLAVFLAVAALPFVVLGGVPFEVYNPLQNLVFLGTVAGLFVLYLREVDAPAAQKAFVFSLVTLFGFFATLTSSNAFYLMGFAEQSDGYMYYPPRLAVMAAVYPVFFCVMTLAATFEALPADRFAYCHRSVVVNLDHVRGLSSERLVLDDGTALPVSRRRYVEVRDALEAR